MRIPILASVLGAGALALLAGCISRTRRVAPPAGAPLPALEASKTELIERYNRQAEAVRGLHAAASLEAETGSAFVGVIKQYRQVSALLLAQRPAYLRVVGQAPVVGTDLFDMVSDGATFRMYVPSKHEFLTGPARLERPGKRTLENLRPQPIFDALLWPAIAPGAFVTIEEEVVEQPPSRDYVLTVLRGQGPSLAIRRRIWFDRSNLRVSRVETYGPNGRLDSDVRYGDWRAAEGEMEFPRRIALSQPNENYRLEIDLTRLTLNAPVPASRFRLEQPAGTKLVEVGKEEGKP